MEEERLKQILNYEYWSSKQNPNTKTTGYVLFVDNEETYTVKFNWSLLELNENKRNFQCGTVTCTFTTDSREFINENIPPEPKKNSKKDYRPILPRTPLQQLYINHISINKNS
ncbi:hypothetical protein Glove_547g42 [Diversispora epigaea]|uniref:Uncharacterized protein n=1 Tax=Diversispora epigaea TaxID=1348612 RepID=A0A397GFD8_9GLOM|nr:hypothetical protein Glove_547g42 [Diversispora epigaea]